MYETRVYCFLYVKRLEIDCTFYHFIDCGYLWGVMGTEGKMAATMLSLFLEITCL